MRDGDYKLNYGRILIVRATCLYIFNYEHDDVSADPCIVHFRWVLYSIIFFGGVFSYIFDVIILFQL